MAKKVDWNALVAFLKKRTHEFAVANEYIKVKKAEEPTVDPKEQEIADLIRELGGCMEGQFRRLFTLVYGKEIPPPTYVAVEGVAVFTRWAVVVCIENPNNHNYGQKDAILVSQVQMDGHRAKGIKADGWKGNWLPDETSAMRPATETEIKEFVTKMETSGLQTAEFFNELLTEV